MSLQKELINWSNESYSGAVARLRSSTGKSIDEIRKALVSSGFDEQKAKSKLLNQKTDSSLIAKQARW